MELETKALLHNAACVHSALAAVDFICDHRTRKPFQVHIMPNETQFRCKNEVPELVMAAIMATINVMAIN